ncbi:Cellulose 1,4-beta-cellobiosidase (non-reducing end) [Zalerion maritima]|uniref:Glucanase n=1 Tax=Zalerion maritima TaxID=339359 RepID=A0AAD5WS93_9PEZI|nr:Cellulose 1,4-beta-cellobiosidase (non-reducing end) [Zalerion maritima]
MRENRRTYTSADINAPTMKQLLVSQSCSLALPPGDVQDNRAFGPLLLVELGVSARGPAADTAKNKSLLNIQSFAQYFFSTWLESHSFVSIMKRYAAISLVAAAAAQQWQRCTGPGSCSTVDAEVVIDANWRRLHEVDGYGNCHDGNEWVDSICGSESECTENCALEGAKYDSTYGASTSGDALELKFVTEHEYGTTIGSRFYLMESEDQYQMLKLMGNKFAFDVELSTLDCGLNGALT